MWNIIKWTELDAFPPKWIDCANMQASEHRNSIHPSIISRLPFEQSVKWMTHRLSWTEIDGITWCRRLWKCDGGGGMIDDEWRTTTAVCVLTQTAYGSRLLVPGSTEFPFPFWKKINNALLCLPYPAPIPSRLGLGRRLNHLSFLPSDGIACLLVAFFLPLIRRFLI